MTKETEVKSKEVENKNKETKKEKVKKESFLKGVREEMKKVTWPKGKDIIKYSIATISLAVFLIAFFALLNLALSFIKGLFV